MSEASLIFPIVMIALSSALMGFLYHQDIAHGVQSCRGLVSRLFSRLIPRLFARLVQHIDTLAKYTASGTYTLSTGQHADNTDLEAGEYELGESPGLLLAPSDGEHPSPSGVEAPSTISSPCSPDSLRSLLSSDDSSNSIPDDMWEVIIRSGRQAQARRSRENRNDHQHQDQHRPAFNVTADADTTPEDWETDAAGRPAWFHGVVDAVVDKFWKKLDPEVVEVVDTV